LRFVDANVFVHAYLVPRRTLSHSEARLKVAAKRIVTKISEGEEVVTSSVHIAEVANLVEDNMEWTDSLMLEKALCVSENIRIEPVTRAQILSAIALLDEKPVGLVDAIARVIMSEVGVTEIYSFDGHFDLFDGVRRLAQ